MCVCVCVCVCSCSLVCVHGVREQLEKGENDGKVNLEKVPKKDSNLQPCACGPTVLSPSTTARCSLALIGGSRVS